MSSVEPNPATERAALIALSALPLMGPARLGAVLGHAGAGQSWALLRSGSPMPIEVSSSVQSAWIGAAGKLDAEALVERHDAAGVTVASRSSADYPQRLAGDPEPPAVLFWKGSLRGVAPETGCVGIVGTRRCTRYGRDVAFELGCVLADAGVTVVSGLALGIDAAAHAGSIHAGGVPIGVVAGGVDMIYPRANAGLWSEVAERGAVVSEQPLTTSAQRWMFPTRNRIIAGLCDVLVVVETGPTGGSFYTVDAALERDRPVFAVPGPVRSVASKGTNRLLADGAAPMCAPKDILEALGLSGLGGSGEANRPPAAPGVEPQLPGIDQPSVSRGTEPVSMSDALLDAFGWQTRSMEDLAAASGLSTPAVAGHLQLLVAQGLVVQRAGRFDRTVGEKRY